jgi:hypothetical protein
MRFYRTFFITATILACTLTAYAQESYTPRISGLVKARFESDTYDGHGRFGVRNARLGADGFATRNVYYNVHIELNALGSLTVLDSYVGYRLGNFDLILGQQSYKFSTELNRGAGSNYFANRSFVAKFISNYQGFDGSLYDMGPRDLGATLQYRGDWKIPVTFCVGTFNGAGLNNPVWNDGMNFVGRIDASLFDGMRVAGSYYGGKAPTASAMLPIEMWEVEAGYVRDRLIVEAEFARRYQKHSSGTDVTTLALVHAMYTFPLKSDAFAKSITPQLRWDYGDNIGFRNLATAAFDGFDAQRITAGICIGLSDKLLRTEIRFNYDFYILKERPGDFASNRLLHNKFTVEMFTRF